MLKILKYYYFYIFFNAYWTNVYWGDKMIARQSAVVYMNLLAIFMLGGVFFVLAGYKIIIKINIVLPCLFAALLILNHFSLSKKVFSEKFNDFEFLSEISKVRRIYLFWSTIILGGLLNIIGGFYFAYS